MKNRPEIVIDFFGMPTAESFCPPFKYHKPEVPNLDAVVVSESLARGPEKATGTDKLILEAKDIYVDKPECALKMVEEAQDILCNSGFRPHAASYEDLRFKILIRIGRVGKAARSILEEIWLTLERGKNDAARFILYNLPNEIKEAPMMSK